MITVSIPAHVYHRLIETFTSPTDRLLYPDRCERLPDGSIRFSLPDDLVALLEPHRHEGESYPDMMERIVATAGRPLS